VSLLHEIRDAAVGDDVSLTVVLRKLKVLAYRLDNAKLSEWVEAELNGYPSAETVPPYRRFPTEVRGDFVGIAWKGSGMPIGRAQVPEGDVRDFLFTAVLTDGVAEYEQLLQTSGQGDKDLGIPWPQEMVALLADRVYTNMRCISAHRILTRAALAGVLDSVRNRALAFVLELEKEIPELATEPESVTGSRVSVTPERVEHLVVQAFYGGQQNIVTDAQHVGDIKQTQVSVGSIESLVAALRDVGLPDDELDDLADAIRADESTGHEKEPGPQTERWLGRIARKLAVGSLGLGAHVTTDLVTGIVLQHFGLK
jgi:hypothetical protein